MARIIVTTDPTEQSGGASVLMDERVHPVHLSSDHSAAQLVERLAWAVRDADNAESGSARRVPGSHRRGMRR
jgi:hypothetical protein